MKKNILPKGWEIGRLSVTLHDLTNPEEWQEIKVNFVDYMDKFCPEIETQGKVTLNAEELSQFAALADKVCKILYYTQVQNNKEIDKK